jgi:hypothetical protein
VPSTLGSATFYIGNIQDISVDNSGFTGILEWESSTKEIYMNTAKTFIIDHPVYLEKYLVHSCLEGPEAAVYYRGSFDITEGLKKYKITLPDYVKEIGKNCLSHLSPSQKEIPSFDSSLPPRCTRASRAPHTAKPKPIYQTFLLAVGGPI